MISITESIELLKAYNGPLGLTLHSGASEELISSVERTYGVILPADIKTLYRFSDGFETDEDIFNLIPLAEIVENKNRDDKGLFYIAEYMIYLDMWQLEISPDDCNDYKIIIEANGNQLEITNSLPEFITRLLKGGVFGPGGLYDWQEEIESQSIYTTKIKTAELLLTVFYYSLRYSLISKKEVTEWADRIVLHEDEPETFFVELSLSHDKNDLIGLLNTVCVTENSVVSRAILGLTYHRLLSNDIGVYEAISIMDKNNFSTMLTEFETDHIYDFTDEIWTNNSTIDENELKQKLLNFLSYYKEFEITNYKYWVGFSYRIDYRFSNKDENSNTGPQAGKGRLKIELWFIYTIVYTLALISIIVLVTTYTTFEGKMLSSKFWSDLYQLCLFYFTLFATYYILKSGDWLVRKLYAGLRKILAR